MREVIRASCLSGLAFFTCSGLLACSEGHDEAEYRDLCVNSSDNTCVVSFFSLMSDRNALLGREVAVAGYIAGVDDEFTMYLCKEHAYNLRRESGIRIVMSDRVISELMREGLNERYVMVSGLVRRSDRWWAEIEVKDVPRQTATLIYDVN